MSISRHEMFDENCQILLNNVLNPYMNPHYMYQPNMFTCTGGGAAYMWHVYGLGMNPLNPNLNPRHVHVEECGN